MSIRPFKYLLQAIAVEEDDETGKPLREVAAEPITVFSAEQAVQAIEKIEQEILALNESAANGKHATQRG